MQQIQTCSLLVSHGPDIRQQFCDSHYNCDWRRNTHVPYCCDSASVHQKTIAAMLETCMSSPQRGWVNLNYLLHTWFTFSHQENATTTHTVYCVYTHSHKYMSTLHVEPCGHSRDDFEKCVQRAENSELAVTGRPDFSN